MTLAEPSGRIAVDPDTGETGRETSRGNVARVAAAVLEEPKAVGTTIDFVDGAWSIEEAVVSTD